MMIRKLNIVEILTQIQFIVTFYIWIYNCLTATLRQFVILDYQ